MTFNANTVLSVSSLSTWLGVQTSEGKRYIEQQLNQWNSNPSVLQEKSQMINRLQQTIQKDKQFTTECTAILGHIAELEAKLSPLAQKESKLEKEAYNELLFLHPITKPFNFIPFVLGFWSILRIYLLPGISFLFPILTLIAPYFILTYLFHLPITFKNYMNLLHSMISGNIQAVLHPESASMERTISPIAFLKQGGIILLTLAQGILQPYWSYQHLKSIDQIIQDQGSLFIEFRKTYVQLKDLLEKKGILLYQCPIPELINERIAMAHMVADPFSFKMAMKYIGAFEVIYRIASRPELNPVKWVSCITPVFRLQHSFDFEVNSTHRKEISVQFDRSHGTHALLTGPNKGGKSTALRAISGSALLAHTFGCAFGSLTATPFAQLFVCLKPDDLPGSKSRFEREIEFTAQTIKMAKTLSNKVPILICIDELYHSTNPPDALRSCQLYSDQLWSQVNAVSVISTHLFEWVDHAPDQIQRLCCPARITDQHEIEFQYDLLPGVCKVSSVDTLLKKNGLIH